MSNVNHTHIAQASTHELTPQQLFDEQLDVEISAHVEIPAASAHTEKEMPPQLDVETFSSQIFWLVVCFAALYLLISRSALPRIHEVVDKRKHRKERDLDRAETLSKQANKAKDEYEALQAKAREKSVALVASATRDIQAHQEAENASMDAQIVTMLSDADAAIAAKQQSFRDDLVSLSEELAAALVKEISGKAATKTVLKSSLSQHS